MSPTPSSQDAGKQDGVAAQPGQDDSYRSLVAKNAELAVAQEALRRRVADLDLLVEIEGDALHARDLDDLLDRLVRRAMQILQSEASCLVLRDETAGDLIFRAAAGGASEKVVRGRLVNGQGVVGWVARNQTPLILNDPASDRRHDANIAKKVAYQPRNLIAVPLLHVAVDQSYVTCLGALEVINRIPGSGNAEYTEEDVKLLSLVAGHAARAIALAQAKEDRITRERLASVGQLLTGILHDLKTPLMIVSGHAQVFAHTDDAKLRSELGRSLLKQVDLMSAMIREVMQFARGETQLLARKVYVHWFLNEVREQLERDLASHNVTLVIEERYDGVASFDELKLHRVIHNLARNAVDAMPEGGVFKITVDRREGDLLFDFSDTGHGIPEEMDGRLFQLFASARKPDGTGLGLAIVKKLVEEHNGCIGYTSHPGVGTTFHVALPIDQSVTAEKQSVTAEK